MISWRHATNATLSVLLALMVQGCAKQDSGDILGHWRAERFELMGLKLPIGPELNITRTALSGGADDLTVALVGITRDADEVTLETEAGIGLTFYFVEPDRMYVKLPLLDKVYYRRVATAVTAPRLDAVAPVRAAPVAPVAAPVQAPASVPVPRPVVVPASTSLRSAALQAYDDAVLAARQGDDDNALRHLHQAFQHGYTGVAQLAQAPEFAHLRKDVRFEVLLSRFGAQ